MHTQNLENWKHRHNFAMIHEKGEQRTLIVLVVTIITMGVEIVAGVVFGSMALLADGWHMGTHVAAFMITIFAYRYARKHQHNLAFTFGTGKVSVLGGFTSAIALAVVALIMSVESVQRLFNPQVIHFNEAIGVATVGLIVNIICAFLLHNHHDDHHHDEKGHQHHHDHNLKAAYLHVLADALTSVLAIIALFAGKYFNWNWLDPLMGIVGAIVITRWAYGLIQETSPILLDRSIEEEKQLVIRHKIESDADNRISDLHVWKAGPDAYAVIISLVTHFPKPTEHYKALLQEVRGLSHITIETHQCLTAPCILPRQGKID